MQAVTCRIGLVAVEDPCLLERTVQCPLHQTQVQAALVDENELVAALRDKLEAGEGHQEDLQAEVQHLQQQLRDVQAQRPQQGFWPKGRCRRGMASGSASKVARSRHSRSCRCVLEFVIRGQQRFHVMAAVFLEVFCSAYFQYLFSAARSILLPTQCMHHFDKRRKSAQWQSYRQMQGARCRLSWGRQGSPLSLQALQSQLRQAQADAELQRQELEAARQDLAALKNRGGSQNELAVLWQRLDAKGQEVQAVKNSHQQQLQVWAAARFRGIRS